MLYDICKPILYRNDVINHSSSSVFYSIVYSRDRQDAMRILEAAKEGGTTFKRCQDAQKSHPLSFHRIDATLHSPLHLAARRGLDSIVTYLINQGLDIDDREGVNLSRRTPLMEAILNHQELTAVLIVRRGASRGLRPPDLEAFQAAVREGLTYLIRVMVERDGLDVNSDIGHGCTPLALAVCHRKAPMITALLELGARALPVMRRFCSDNAFLPILWMLDADSTHLLKSLELGEVMELTISITVERVSSSQANQQAIALEQLLDFLCGDGSVLGSTASLTAWDFSDFLDALMQMVLSVDYTDARLASLFHKRGAKVQTGLFLRLTQILNSSLFKENTRFCLRRNPGLLHCFNFVYSHSLHCPVLTKRWAVKYFLDQVPVYILWLIEELKQKDLPLNRCGVEQLDLTRFNAGTVPE